MKYQPRKVFVKENEGFIEITYEELCVRREQDCSYDNRYFIPVQGGLLEVPERTYAEFYREEERMRYLEKQDHDHGLLSSDAVDFDQCRKLETLDGEGEDVAEVVIRKMLIEKLRECICLLSVSEQDLVNALYFEQLTEREYAKQKGVYRNAVHKKKIKILAKLKKLLEK